LLCNSPLIDTKKFSHNQNQFSVILIMGLMLLGANAKASLALTGAGRLGLPFLSDSNSWDATTGKIQEA
jgi:hypothetical protein